MKRVWRALWRVAKAAAWRYDPLGASASEWAPRSWLWRVADGLHRLAYPPAPRILSHHRRRRKP